MLYLIPKTHRQRVRQNYQCPFPSLKAINFYLPSPEAYFLTSPKGKIILNHLIRRIMVQTKERGVVRVRGREYGLRGGSDQPDLIFGDFWIKPKVTSLSGNERLKAIGSHSLSP